MNKRYKVLKEMKWVPLPQLSHRELAVKIIRTSGIDLVHWHNALAEMMERELNEQK